jgi:hypothetical protein
MKEGLSEEKSLNSEEKDVCRINDELQSLSKDENRGNSKTISAKDISEFNESLKISCARYMYNEGLSSNASISDNTFSVREDRFLNKELINMINSPNVFFSL